MDAAGLDEWFTGRVFENKWAEMRNQIADGAVRMNQVSMQLLLGRLHLPIRTANLTQPTPIAKALPPATICP